AGTRRGSNDGAAHQHAAEPSRPGLGDAGLFGCRRSDLGPALDVAALDPGRRGGHTAHRPAALRRRGDGAIRVEILSETSHAKLDERGRRMRIRSLTLAALLAATGLLPAQEKPRLFGKPRAGDCGPPCDQVCPPPDATRPPTDSTAPPPST